MPLLRRLGTFLILIGLVLLVLYAMSVISKDVKTSYLLIGLLAFVMGVLMQRNKQPSDSGRFSALRRASALSRQRREEKMNQKPKK
jgi:uncharacterized membrane protein